MFRLISALFLKIMGWKVQDDFINELPTKCVVTAAPHTSNWDGIYMRMAFSALRVPVRWALKDEFMKFPLNLLFGPLGAIGIDRRSKNAGDKKISTTEAMIKLFDNYDRLMLAIAPEGTRSLRTKWKSGFYYLAKGANVPIAFGYLDFKNKKAGIGGYIIPSDNMEEDMRKIMAFYKPIVGQNPELFSVDQRYDTEKIE